MNSTRDRLHHSQRTAQETDIMKESRKEPKHTPGEEVKNTLREEVKNSPTEEMKNTPGEEVKNTLNEEVKNSPTEEMKNTTGEEVKNTLNEEVKNSPTEEVKNSPGQEVKNTLHEEVKNSPTEEMKNTTGEEVKNTLNEEVKNSPTEEVKNSPGQEVKNTLHEEVKNSPTEEMKNTTGEEVKNTLHEEVKNSPTEEMKNTTGEEVKNTLHEEVKNSPTEEMKNTTGEEVKNILNEEVKKSPTKEMKKTPGEEVKNTLSEEVKNSPTEEVKNSPGQEVKNTLNEEVKNSPGEEVKNSPTEEMKNSPGEEERVKSILGEEVNTPSADVKNSLREEVTNTADGDVKHTPREKSINMTKEEVITVSREDWLGEAVGLSCDVCTDRNLNAVRSCLVCLTSYCQPHLEPHLSTARLRGHKLVPPVGDLEQRACSAHGRPLELYCRDTQRCICALCVEQGHHIVPAETEWERKKAAVQSVREEMERRVAVRLMKMEEIRQVEKLSTAHVDRQKEEMETVFGAVAGRVMEAREELLRPLLEKQREVQREAQHFTHELEDEIFELRQKISKLDHISNDADHVHFLQSFPSLPGPKHERDWAGVAVDTELSLGSMRTVLSAMVGQIDEELERLSAIEIKRIQKFSVSVTFDPNSAHPNLVVSEGRTAVRDGGVPQDVPDGPERFDLYGSVLGLPLLGTGRHYWEVQVGEKTGWDLGVASQSINRKGPIAFSPQQGLWCLVHFNTHHYAAMTDPATRLTLPHQPRTVGVYVDYERGQVSFYNVEARSHIYSFTGNTFTEKLYPYFSPHLTADNRNTDPLVISPSVRHTDF